MTTAWNHLPNAGHIDRILADLNANPDNWARAWDRAWAASRTAAWDAAWAAFSDSARNGADAFRTAASSAVWAAAWDRAWDAARDRAWFAARSAATVAAWDAARDVAGTAILALIAWPESAEYLDLSVDSLRVLAALGDHKAILILPAVIVFESHRELVV